MLQPIARVSKLFGTEGGLLLNLYTAFPDDFSPEQEPLFATIDQLSVPLYCDRFERRGRTGALVRFADLDTDRRAEELLGLELAITREEEADDDEFYLEDLIGFGVKVGRLRGEITDFYDSEANPLFEIALDGRAVLVPAVEEFIAGIDFEKKEVKMVLPDGLVELQ